MKWSLKLVTILLTMIFLASCGVQKQLSEEELKQKEFLATNGLQVLSSAEYSGTWETQASSDLTGLTIDTVGNVNVQINGVLVHEKLVKNSEDEIFITDTKNNQLLRVYVSGSYIEIYKPNGRGYSFTKKENKNNEKEIPEKAESKFKSDKRDNDRYDEKDKERSNDEE